MKFIAVLLAVFAVVLCTVQAAPAPAPQFAAIAGSPLAYSGYSAYSPYVYSGGLGYSPYNTLGYSNLGYSVGGLSAYTYY